MSPNEHTRVDTPFSLSVLDFAEVLPEHNIEDVSSDDEETTDGDLLAMDASEDECESSEYTIDDVPLVNSWIGTLEFAAPDVDDEVEGLDEYDRCENNYVDGSAYVFRQYPRKTT